MNPSIRLSIMSNLNLNDIWPDRGILARTPCNNMIGVNLTNSPRDK